MADKTVKVKIEDPDSRVVDPVVEMTEDEAKDRRKVVKEETVTDRQAKVMRTDNTFPNSDEVETAMVEANESATRKSRGRKASTQTKATASKNVKTSSVSKTTTKKST